MVHVSATFVLVLALSMSSFAQVSRGESQDFTHSAWPMFGHDSRRTHRCDSASPTSREKRRCYLADQIIGYPVIGSDGTVLVTSFDCLYAINSGGVLKWKFSKKGMFSWSAPAIGSDGTIYIGAMDSLLYAINQDGNLKWKFRTDGEISSYTAIGFDGTIYICPGAEYVYAVNPDGTLKWKTHIPGLNEISPAVDVDNTVYVRSRNSVYALNPDGTIRWECETSLTMSSPAIGSDGTIYIATSEDAFIAPGYVYAINHEGTVKWKYKTTGFLYIGVSIAIGADGTVYTGSSDFPDAVADVAVADYYLNAINADGTEKWRLKTGFFPLRSTITVGGDGCIYIASKIQNNYGGVVAVNPDGSVKWKLRSEYYGMPEFLALGGDGALYYCVGPVLYALVPEQATSVGYKPLSYMLGNPRPNPFNPSTVLDFSLPASSSVKIDVFAINGQKVATLVDGRMSAGQHSVVFDGSKHASGVYIYRFKSGAMEKFGKMMLAK